MKKTIIKQLLIIIKKKKVIVNARETFQYVGSMNNIYIQLNRLKTMGYITIEKNEFTMELIIRITKKGKEVKL